MSANRVYTESDLLEMDAKELREAAVAVGAIPKDVEDKDVPKRNALTGLIISKQNENEEKAKDEANRLAQEEAEREAEEARVEAEQKAAKEAAEQEEAERKAKEMASEKGKNRKERQFTFPVEIVEAIIPLIATFRRGGTRFSPKEVMVKERLYIVSVDLKEANIVITDQGDPYGARRASIRLNKFLTQAGLDPGKVTATMTRAERRELLKQSRAIETDVREDAEKELETMVKERDALRGGTQTTIPLRGWVNVTLTQSKDVEALELEEEKG